jgi:cysteine desulfurase/selenocysteine lyase
VLRPVHHAYTAEYANVQRSTLPANAATEAYEDARGVARFINAGRKEEIVFTRNATEAINLVAAFGRERIKAGDEIVLSIMDTIPTSCRGIRERHGAVTGRRSDGRNFLIDEFESWARAPKWSRSPRCRTCSAPSCR